MERGAKDTWQSAVATWNGISVPLFPLLGSAAAEPSSKAEAADEGPLAPHGGPLPPHSNSAVAPGAPKAARRRRLPASFQSSANFDALRFYRETWACFKGLSKSSYRAAVQLVLY